MKLRVIYLLKKISEQIQIYGTSHYLFDLSTRDKLYVKRILYPIEEQIELNYKNKEQNQTQTVKLAFPLMHPQSNIKLYVTPFFTLVELFLNNK